jgi:hypothetical protein
VDTIQARKTCTPLALLLNQLGDQARPASLMAGTDARAIALLDVTAHCSHLRLTSF